jgi:acyl carrier protein
MGLDSVELVMAWEEHFEIEIPNELAGTLVTPRMAIDAIEQLLKKKPADTRVWTREEIERDVCTLIVEQIGITRRDFTLDSHFTRDMGVD